MMIRRALAIGGLSIGLAVAGAQLPAGANQHLLVAVERTYDARLTSPNFVPVTVTVVDAATKAPPSENFIVSAYATNDAGEETEPYECGNREYVTAGAPPGVYDCVVVVDHGGTWTFHGVVNAIPADAKDEDDLLKRLVTVARGSVDMAVDAPTLQGEAPDIDAVDGNARDVLLLVSHSLLAGLWALLVFAVMAVAVPRIRRVISPGALHHLEDRLVVVEKGLVGATAAVIVTGGWLLWSNTGYEAPFSISEAEAVFKLPYGQPYFLALWLKIGFYALMVALTVPVAREARRRTRLADDGGRAASGRPRRGAMSPWASPVPATRPPSGASERAAGGAARRSPPTGTITVERPDAPAQTTDAAQAVTKQSSWWTRLAVVMMAVGGLVIIVCVTLLKYFHELIEASSALLR